MNILKLSTASKIGDWLSTVNSIVEYIKNASEIFVNKDELTELKNQLSLLEEKYKEQESILEEKANRSDIKEVKIPKQNISEEDARNLIVDMKKAEKDISCLKDGLDTSVSSLKAEFENKIYLNSIEQVKELSRISTNISKKITTIKKSLIDIMYPVGSVYITLNEDNPEDLFGGVWEKIKDRFLLASGDAEVGEEGGQRTQTLSVENIPSHSHSISVDGVPNHSHNLGTLKGSYRCYHEDENGKFVGAIEHKVTKKAENSPIGALNFIGNLSEAGKHTHTATIEETGEGKEFDILPPYVIVHMWKRIS